MELQANSPNEIELAKLDLLQRRYREYGNDYVEANSALYSAVEGLPKPDIETAKNNFDRAELEYRSFVIEMMRKYNLVSF